MFVWCPSWAACVTYNILLCWLAIKIIRAIYSARSESSLQICSSFQISLQGVMTTFSVVTIAVKCQWDAHQALDYTPVQKYFHMLNLIWSKKEADNWFFNFFHCVWFCVCSFSTSCPLAHHGMNSRFRSLAYECLSSIRLCWLFGNVPRESHHDISHPSTNTSPAHNPQAEQIERSRLVTLRGDWSNLTLSDGESREEVVLHLGKERTIQPSHGDASAGTCSDSIRHSGQHTGASARLWRTDQVGEIKRTKKWFDVRTWWRIMGSSFEQQPVVRGYKLWLIFYISSYIMAS